MNSVCIVGTGLIGASIGLALREAGFAGAITGIDASGDELKAALESKAIDRAARSPKEHREALHAADVIVLAVPVLAIQHWMRQMAAELREDQLVTDVGSTKAEISLMAERLMPGRFLPGHPMAGKESGGAALAETALFHGAAWLFTPLHETTGLESEWRGWVERMGARMMDLTPEQHDRICAWVSHMPQFVSTAMSAMLEEEFGESAEMRAIGGRALREMTRLGASPFSMWRDIAHSNERAIAETLLRMEQQLQHMRENLKTPELREAFAKANAFRRQL